MILRISICF